MPQTVSGYGSVSLKPGAKARIAEAAERFEGWLEWDQFDLTEDRLSYAYDDIVTIGTAGDLDDFLEDIAANHASAAWAHYGADGDVEFYGPSEQGRVEAEIAEREAELRAAEQALAAARAKYTRVTSA